MSFARVKALGWALFETLTSSQMTQLDIDHSKATDSTYVKDYGAALFLQTAIAVATWTRPTTTAYIAPLNTWVGCGTGGSCRTIGASLVTAASTFPATSWSSMAPAAIAFDGASVLICGGLKASSTDKIRRTTVSVNCDVWTAQSAAASNSFGPILGWFPAAGLFVAGYTNGAIETSPDGITWTTRTPVNGLEFVQFACNSTIAVMVQKDASIKNQYATSTNGTTWTLRTYPITPTGSIAGISYSPIDGMFLVVDNTGVTVMKSPDGINWTVVTPVYAPSISTPIGAIVLVQSLSNLWLAGFNGASNNGLICSADVGATWKPLYTTAGFAQSLGVSAGQIAFADTAAIHFSGQLSL